MATDETWRKLVHFSPLENWGNAAAIADSLLFKLDDFRGYLGTPIMVLNGTQGVHSRGSYHYLKNGACAADIIIPDYKGTPFDLVLDATRFGFTGIGYYPHWEYKGKKANGLHLDDRPLKWDADSTLNYKHNRWMGIREEGAQVYIPLTFENIAKYGR